MVEEQIIHLIVEDGPDRGKEIAVRPAGIRIGRSSNNDVALSDPVMSRFHCRLFFKPHEGLWVEDLGSANNTLVNSSPVRLSRLKRDDRLTLGDTTLKVVSDEMPSSSAAQLFKGVTEETGLKSGDKPESENRKKQFLTGLFVAGACAVGVLVLIVMQKNPSGETGNTIPAAENEQAIEIEFEKIQASPKNIFRYDLELKNGELSVQIDDLENTRHVPKNQRKKIEAETAKALIEAIQQSDFYNLKESYKGSLEQVYDLMDLTITIGSRTHRVRVLNTIEPEQFQKAREAIEELAQNEIGLTALALTKEKLLELAKASALLGRSLYDQREVKRENLSLAIRALKETEWYLETIEPKPGYYADAVALHQQAERELNETYQNHLFLSERAIKLSDWQEAAGQLRIITEIIPERSDERNRKAFKKLIDVERHLKKK
jgi:pSer/pThr/pTyr-binding forkhead associated (FHA) protein